MPHGNFPITRVQGPLMMSNLLVMRTEGEQNLTKAHDLKDKEVTDRRLAYEKCRGGCECEGDKCLAAGLHLCRYCNI